MPRGGVPGGCLVSPTGEDKTRVPGSPGSTRPKVWKLPVGPPGTPARHCHVTWAPWPTTMAPTGLSTRFLVTSGGHEAERPWSHSDVTVELDSRVVHDDSRQVHSRHVTHRLSFASWRVGHCREWLADKESSSCHVETLTMERFLGSRQANRSIVRRECTPPVSVSM